MTWANYLWQPPTHSSQNSRKTAAKPQSLIDITFKKYKSHFRNTLLDRVRESVGGSVHSGVLQDVFGQRLNLPPCCDDLLDELVLVGELLELLVELQLIKTYHLVLDHEIFEMGLTQNHILADLGVHLVGVGILLGQVSAAGFLQLELGLVVLEDGLCVS